MWRIRAALIWLIITLFVAYAFCLNTASAVFSDTIKSSLQISDLSASLAMGAFIAGFAIMQIPAGFLLDKYNPRWVVSAGVLLLAIGNLMISFADNVVLFSIANLIQGLGGAFAFIAAGVLIAEWFTPRAFPIMFGLTQTLSCFIVGYMHYLFVSLLQVMNWNTLYQYLSVFGFALFILTIVFVKRPESSDNRPSLSFTSSLKIVCSNAQIWLCALTAAMSFGILMAYAGFWYLKIQNFYSVTVNDSLLISALIFAGIGIGTPVLGWLSNVFKSRIMVIHTGLALGNMMLLLNIYLPNFSGSMYVIYLVSFLMGFFLAASELIYTVISEISTNQTRGVALSFVNTGIFLMNTIMMFMPYFFITLSSTSFFTYLWVLPFGVTLAILSVFFIKETYKS